MKIIKALKIVCGIIAAILIIWFLVVFVMSFIGVYSA